MCDDVDMSSTAVYTGKNREKIFLNICVFLQNSDFFSQNEQFFPHFEKKIRILEKNTNF
jgi:hypothetical protein